MGGGQSDRALNLSLIWKIYLHAETIRMMSPSISLVPVKDYLLWVTMTFISFSARPTTWQCGAAQIVNVAAKGLTILFKELEKQGLMGEIEALERMLTYVSTDGCCHTSGWIQRINESLGMIGPT